MRETANDSTVIDDCWNRIGVWSDSTSRNCPQLQEIVHCRNCPVFAAAARKIFEGRSLPPDYLEEWCHHFAQPPPARQMPGHASVLVFRVGSEALSLPIGVIDEICQPVMIHRLPHCAQAILRGIVNIHGQLRLCFSLAELLGIDDSQFEWKEKHRVFPRMMLVRHNESHFALLVDEVVGSLRYGLEEVLPVPSSISRALTKFMRGIVREEEKTIGLLDEERVFQALEKSLK
jgi:chemotaxis-related protein WspD